MFYIIPSRTNQIFIDSPCRLLHVREEMVSTFLLKYLTLFYRKYLELRVSLRRKQYNEFLLKIFIQLLSILFLMLSYFF